MKSRLFGNLMILQDLTTSRLVVDEGSAIWQLGGSSRILGRLLSSQSDKCVLRYVFNVFLPSFVPCLFLSSVVFTYFRVKRVFL